MSNDVPRSSDQNQRKVAPEANIEGVSMVNWFRALIATLPRKAGEWLEKMGGSLQTLAEFNPYIIMANGGRKAQSRYDKKVER
jgi:hypothetical protein